jgi:hypothetical protein
MQPKKRRISKRSKEENRSNVKWEHCTNTRACRPDQATWRGGGVVRSNQQVDTNALDTTHVRSLSTFVVCCMFVVCLVVVGMMLRANADRVCWCRAVRYRYGLHVCGVIADKYGKH